MLTSPQISVLTKGLGFVPNINQNTDYTPSVRRLTRHIRLMHHFRRTEVESSQFECNPPPFKRVSTWAPPPADKDAEAYLCELPKKLQGMRKRAFNDNLNRSERFAIKQLKQNTSIVIKNADKGSCIVSEDKVKYIQEGMKHLEDRRIYETVEEDVTIPLVEAINGYVKTIHKREYLSSDMLDYLTCLKPTDVRTQQIYFLKKLHKTPHSVRPIVSGTAGPTERLSSFMDYFLQPLVENTPSYIKDSSTIISLVEHTTFPGDCILASINVCSLYLNIPHEEGVSSALKHLYNINPKKNDLPFPPSVAAEMLRIILESNHFEFVGNMYKQVQGTAMGTKMAPAYANLFMSELETEFLKEEIVRPLVWRRFIDDILVIWPDSKEKLVELLTRLNKYHATIKFTSTISPEEVTFMDLTIFKGKRFNECGKLDIRPHFKKTNKFQYLHYSSCHPRSTFQGIVRGELIRILRASSSDETYQTNCSLIKRRFRERGYPSRMLRDASMYMTYSSQPKLLCEGNANMDKDRTKEPPPFITRYNDKISMYELKKALEPNRNTTISPRICFSRNKTLSQQVVRARLPDVGKPNPSAKHYLIYHRPSLKGSSAPCGTPLCRTCKCMSAKEVIYSAHGNPYKVPSNTNCSSRNLIYLLECTLCPARGRYVGQTSRTMRVRMAAHRAVHTKKNMPLYRHLKRKEHHFEHLRVTILELLQNPTERQLLVREEDWMKKLNTKLPNGLNSLYSKTIEN